MPPFNTELPLEFLRLQSSDPSTIQTIAREEGLDLPVDEESQLELDYLQPLPIEDNDSEDEDYVPGDEFDSFYEDLSDWGSEEDWTSPIIPCLSTPLQTPFSQEILLSPADLGSKENPIIISSEDEDETSIYCCSDNEMVDLPDFLLQTPPSVLRTPSPIPVTSPPVIASRNIGWRRRVRAPSPEWIRVVRRRVNYDNVDE